MHLKKPLITVHKADCMVAKNKIPYIFHRIIQRTPAGASWANKSLRSIKEYAVRIFKRNEFK